MTLVLPVAIFLVIVRASVAVVVTSFATGPASSRWFGDGGHSLRFEPLSSENQTQILTLMEPTPWKRYYSRAACHDSRKKDLDQKYFVWCASGSPIIYSTKYKFGYMKVAKAASTAIFAYFTSQFPDAKEVSKEDLPEDAYVFTFVRKPFEQKLSGYAEVELKETRFSRYGASQKTLFQDVPRELDHGRKRFTTFLDDLELRRFDAKDKRKPSHANTQVAGIMCTHMVNFVGHLEHVTADWAHIQEEAKLPMQLRTKAIPIVHDGTDSQYLRDERVPLDRSLEKRLCNMFRSDFVCLGYEKHCT